jgi:chromate transporter
MLTSVAVVAQAVWSMARSLCPDLQRKAIAVLALILLLLDGSATTQSTAMLIGALGGGFLCRTVQPPAFTPPVGLDLRKASILVAVLCGLLLVLSLLGRSEPHGPIALVFGGGHVVLPILRAALVPSGWISDDAFLSGYGFAQALPGPLFTFAAYLGAASARGARNRLGSQCGRGRSTGRRALSPGVDCCDSQWARLQRVLTMCNLGLIARLPSRIYHLDVRAACRCVYRGLATQREM